MNQYERKEKYRELCSCDLTVPIFSKDWWLDVVAGADNWDVAIVESGGRVVAALPFVIRKKYGFTLVTHPPCTQTLGPWLLETGAKTANRLAREKELMTALILQLPKFAHFQQNWNCNYSNWLPFYWAGFKQTTRYTYVIPSLVDLNAVWSGFRENIKTDCRKAEGRYSITIRRGADIHNFLKVNEKTFRRQGLSSPYSSDFLCRVDLACANNKSREIFLAEDPEGRCHAGVYLVWDGQCAYYLMGGGDPDLRSSGATSLCIWNAIQYAATVTKKFDFEGSMIEPIERFFRAFGAEQVPYHSITKTPSRLLNFYYSVRDK